MKRNWKIALVAGAALSGACSGEPASSTADGQAAQPAADTPAMEADASVQMGGTDPITALCLDMMSSYDRETCDCGTEAFRASTDNADTYADMASYYLNETDPALSLVERWDEVVDVVLADEQGSKLQMSNALGKAHRAALKGCEG